MTNTIIPDEHNLVATINQLTEQIPDSGFDGLSDLLLLFQDVFAESPQHEDLKLTLSTEKNDCLKNFFVAATAHLHNAPEQLTIQTLINNLKDFSEELLIDDEDIALIQESLKQDQAPEFSESCVAIVNHYREQYKLLLQQAEKIELNGILDVLYLVDEWLETHVEDTRIETSSLSVCYEIAVATQDYLSAKGDQTGNIDILISKLGKLDNSLQLDVEDSTLLSSLLLEESTLITPEHSDSSVVESQNSGTGCTDNIVQEDNSDILSLNDYRDQLKLSLQQAETFGLSGVQDILYLFDEWLEEHSEDSNLAAASISVCDDIANAAQAYLSANGEQTVNIETLIRNLGRLDKSLLLNEEDSALLTNLLLEESALINPEHSESSAIESRTSDNDCTDTVVQKDDSAIPTLKNSREQLKLCLQQAESLELSGIQDILYLLDEWLEEPINTRNIPASSLSACGTIVQTIQAYLSGQGDSKENINTLLTSMASLSDTLLLDEEDSQLLTNLLKEEAALIHRSVTDTLAAKQPVANDHKIELNTQEETNEIPDYLEEYVDILSIVFLPIKSSLDKLYANVQNQQTLTAIKESTPESLKDDLEKLTLIANTAEFIGLHQSSLHVQSNLPFIVNDDINIVSETIALFHEWSNSVIDYLAAPLAEANIHQLLVINCSPLWPVVLKEELAANLLIELQSLDRRAEANKAKERQLVASEEDVSLTLPDNVSAVLIDSLLEELPEQTATFSAAIEHLSQGGSMDDVTAAQRVAHTLKGAGNTVNVRGIANITHHLEDILTALADENILPDANIIATLHRASDCLEEMTETLTSNTPPPMDAVEVLQEILDVASRIDNEGITQIIQNNSDAIIESQSNQAATQPLNNKAVEETKEEKESEQMIRLPVSTVDKLLQFSDEMMINNGQLREQLKSAIAETKLLQAHLEQFHFHSMELLGLVDMQRIHQIQNQVVSARNDGFDSLEMDQYNELYSTSLRIHEMTSDSREMNRGFANQLRDIDTYLIEQGYLNGASQTSLLDMRTVAVQSIVPRLQRGVRQAARMTGKEIELRLSGQDLLVDKDILNSVLDPLMHLLRNAVGHGIETRQDRIKVGKPEQGNIVLHFRREKNMIAIDCIDDGSGLNLAAIKQKALKIGMINEDSDLSDDELKQLIMQPNFSTQDEVSQISGRGVGMDAVNAGIRALGGTLRLESEAGKGCTFHILLPLSLAHHNCLLVNVGAQTLAVTELGIEQILLADSGKLTIENDTHWFLFDEKKYVVKTIESLLSRVNPDQKITLEAKTFLLVNYQEQSFAIAVESVKSVSEMIVKDLNDVLPHIHGVIGASTLNDGSIATVIDIQELLQEPSRWGAQTDEQFAEENSIDQTKVLVVDDSLSARRSLEQFFSDMGFQIMSARDGLDALEQLDNQIPDIIVTDMEMPRVNGIELTENIRRDGGTKELPVVMITSRATAKHKKMAEDKGVNAYLTKPFSEDELSSTVMELLANQPSVA